MLIIQKVNYTKIRAVIPQLTKAIRARIAINK